MNPIFFDLSSNNYSPYPNDHYQDHLHTHQFLNPNSQPSSSSTRSLTTHLFLSSNDQNDVFSSELQSQQEGDKYGSQPYNDHGINNLNNDLHQVKWMCSKMRVMLKMKKLNEQVPINQNTYSSTTHRDTVKLEEQETGNSSNSTSPIKVCSDCNTTKTPLWRSGPQGPKSLCNACGIRQRKARRAMAAAAAAENNNNFVLNNRSIITPLKVTKTHHKKPSYIKGHATKYKKIRQYSKQITTTYSPPQPPLSSPSTSSSPSSSPSTSSSSLDLARKINMEDYLASISKNLTFYNVLPQDEKEAAILLMAISCGYAHET